MNMLVNGICTRSKARVLRQPQQVEEDENIISRDVAQLRCVAGGGWQGTKAITPRLPVREGTSAGDNGPGKGSRGNVSTSQVTTTIGRQRCSCRSCRSCRAKRWT